MTQDPRQLDPDRLAAEARSLRALARAAAGGALDGDDLAQDAWVTVLQKPPEAGFSLTHWLRGIVRNHARDAQRAIRRRRAREEFAARPEAADLDDTVERLDLLRHLLAEARGLDEPFRTTILLRYVDGLSTEAIAQRLGLPAGTVRARLHRGLERLRARMDDSVPGGRSAWAAPFALYLYLPSKAVAAGVAAPAAGTTLLPAAAGLTLVMTLKKTLATLVVLAVAGVSAVALWPADWSHGPRTSEDVPATAGDSRQAAASVARQASTDAEDSAPMARAEVERASNDESATTAPGLVLVVRGLVRSSAGAPVPGADVLIGLRTPTTDVALAKLFSSNVSYSSEPRPKLSTEQVRSDAEGRFTARLPVETLDKMWDVYASARAQGFVYTRVEGQSAPGVARVDLELSMPAGARIAGHVVAPDGAAVAAARVWTRRPSQLPVETGADGAFVLDDVDPQEASYGVLAEADGYLPALIEVSREEGRYPQDVQIPLAYGAAVAGSVFSAGRPVAGAELRMMGGKKRPADLPRATSDADGRFRFAAVGAGTFTLQARHADLPSAEVEIDVPAVQRSGVVVRQDMFLEAGRSLRGTVLDRAGQPVIHAEVVVMQAKTVLRAQRSDESGAFAFAGLPQEVVSLRAVAPGFEVLHSGDLPLGQEVVELRMEAGSGFAAMIVDAVTGAPIDSFKVRLWVSEGADSSFTYPVGGPEAFEDAGGIYQTREPGFEEGFIANLEVVANGYAKARAVRLVASKNPDPAAVRIELEPGAELAGVVLDIEDQPLAATEVELLLAGSALGSQLQMADQRAATKADGTFRFEHVPAGTHRLRVRDETHGECVHSFTLPVGASSWRETVQFESGAALGGTVRSPTGELMAGVPVQLQRIAPPEGARFRWATESDAEGRFSFSRLAAGDYELQRIETRDEAPSGKPMPLFSVPVTIAGAGSLNVELAPRGAGRIEGRLVADVALPAVVYLRLEPLSVPDGEPGTRRFPRWLRAHDGALSIPYLLAGRYRLSAFPGSAGDLVGEAEIEVQDGARSEVELRLRPRDR